MQGHLISFYYYESCPNIYKCKSCKRHSSSNICLNLKRLYQKEQAILNRRDKDNSIRRSNARNTGVNYINKVIVIGNFKCSTKDLAILLNVDNQGLEPKYIENYLEYKPSPNDSKLISKLKIELKDYIFKCPSNMEPLEYFLSTITYESFNINQLNLYSNAIKYYFTSTNFKLVNIKNPHKFINYEGSWNDLFINFFLGNPNYRGNDTKFLARFSREINISRDLLTRYFYYYNDEKYFTTCDIEYISKHSGYSLTKNEFVEIIKNINILSKKF